MQNYVLNTDAIRQVEQSAISQLYGDPLSLMIHAAQSLHQWIVQNYPKELSVTIYCGPGNNGGDGMLLALLLHQTGFDVIVHFSDSINALSPILKKIAKDVMNSGIRYFDIATPCSEETDLIVDALFGIGYKGKLSSIYQNVIAAINSSGKDILSIDIASGLEANTGYIDSIAICATTTYTFIAAKPGLYTANGPDYSGNIIVDNLNLSSLINNANATSLLTEESIHISFPKRKKNSHKYDYGRVLVIGGGRGMFGACLLAAKAASRVGCGLVSIACHPAYEGMHVSLLPEALCYGIDDPSELAALLSKVDCCILGPGLGHDKWAESMYLAAIKAHIPTIVDASALHWLKKYPQIDENWVLTPHSGEASQLLDISPEQVEQNRFEAAESLQLQYGGVVVLKGCGTLIQTTDLTYICPYGNPGMATAGMGDVLSGVIAGFLAQHLPLAEAVKHGVLLHAKAGDCVQAEHGVRGILASDLFPYLQMLSSDL